MFPKTGFYLTFFKADLFNFQASSSVWLLWFDDRGMADSMNIVLLLNRPSQHKRWVNVNITIKKDLSLLTTNNEFGIQTDGDFWFLDNNNMMFYVRFSVTSIRLHTVKQKQDNLKDNRGQKVASRAENRIAHHDIQTIVLFGKQQRARF